MQRHRQARLGGLAMLAALIVCACSERRADIDAATSREIQRSVGPVGGRTMQQCVKIESDRLDTCLKFAEDLRGCYRMYDVRYRECQEGFGAPR